MKIGGARLKTLFVVNFSPYPPTSGTPLRVWQHINVFATRGPVSVFSVGGEREPGIDAIPNTERWTHVNSSDYPKLRGLLSLVSRIIFPRQYSVPNALARFSINRRLRDEIRRFRPDVIVLSHWKNACPTPVRKHAYMILDLHNIESVLGTDLRHIKFELWRRLIMWRWQRRERGLARLAKHVWVCGINDVAALATLDAKLPAPLIWPNAVDLKRYDAVRAGSLTLPARLESRVPTIGYFGLYLYRPNLEAALELIEQIFPIIQRRLPNARLLLAGDGPSPAMENAARQNSSIIVTGKVADMQPYLAAADVCVVPIRSGGGTRLKILECFAAKIPVVSTAKGVEGIDAVPDRDIRIAESSRELAETAIELLLRPDLRAIQAESAFELARRSYSWDAMVERLNADANLPR